MMRRVVSFSLLSILLLSTGTCIAYGNNNQLKAQFLQEATDLINDNQILKSWQNSSTKIGIGTVQEVACKLESLDKDHQTIFTYAEILVEIPLTDNLASEQRIVTKYIGGQIGDKGLTAVMDWPSFPNDTVTPPNVFELKAGMNIMFFVREDTEILAGYIQYSMFKDENTNSVLLTQESQPTTEVTESAGYGFGWSYGFHYHWEDLPIYYYIDSVGTNDIDGSGTDREFAAIQAACSAWESDPCSGIVFSYGGTQYHYDSWVDYACWPGGPGANGDGHSMIGWVSDYSHQNDTGTALALTFRHYQAEEGGLWHLSESDIMIVDSGYNWVIGPTWGYNDFDVQSLVTHELGHLLGFDDLTMQGNGDQTMSQPMDRYGNTDFQTLEWGDLNGAHYLYPEHDDAGSGADAGDSFNEATYLSQRDNYYYGRLCRLPDDTDVDYFKFYAPAGMWIGITLWPGRADLDLELYDPNNNLVDWSRQNGAGVEEHVGGQPVGTSGFWAMRIYTTDNNGPESNGEYEFLLFDYSAEYVSDIAWAGTLSGYGGVYIPENEIGSSPDDNFAGIYGETVGDSAAIIGYLNEPAYDSSSIYIYGYTMNGWRGRVSVYVSWNNYYDWYPVVEQVTIDEWGPGPVTIYIGSTDYSFRYIGIAFSIEDWWGAGLVIDCVVVTP